MKWWYDRSYTIWNLDTDRVNRRYIGKYSEYFLGTSGKSQYSMLSDLHVCKNYNRER
jgi:hypothetical protein